MEKISKIEAQKRPGRYNIYLDGKYAFSVAESVLIKYRLMKGMELDQTQLAQISNDDEIARTYNKMLDYLAHQLRTEHDVYEKMRQLKTPAEDIEPVMQKLRIGYRQCPGAVYTRAAAGERDQAGQKAV